MKLCTPVILGMMVLVGCGTPGIDVKLAPVTGVVTKEGKPLADVKVMLTSSDPSSKAPMLLGVTNAEGRYEITTSAGEKGAPAGLYNVYLAQVQPAATLITQSHRLADPRRTQT